MADFFKPLEPKTPGLEFTLAPLILQEVGPPNSPPVRFGSVNPSGDSIVFDESHASIYFAADSVRINGKAHARMAYIWCYAAEETKKDGGTRARVQGIRITTDASGRPAIWEVLQDSAGINLFFVSEALESKARMRFGEPLKGRRYAIEGSLDEAPNVVVARVIQDGPTPMGPIVYMSSHPVQVSTLICRCMPAQATNIVETRSYDFSPFEKVSTKLLLIKAQASRPTSFWPGAVQSDKLEAALRLQPDF